MNPKSLNIKPYISEEKIQEKVKQIGEQLTAKFKGQKVVAVSD
jgi:hypoxanthine phosphoribosyltransferase